MTSLLLVVQLALAQSDAPPPPPSAPPVIRMEGTTSAPNGQPPPPPPPSAKPAPDAPVAAPPPAPAAVPAPAPAPGTRGGPVFLSIHSNRPDLLLLRADNDETVCTVPCDKLVPGGPKDEYYLGGKGITSSNNFDLAEGIKGARIDVRAGAKAGKIVGIILTALGAPLTLSGGLNMVSWGILQDPAIQAQLAQRGTQQFISPTVTLVLAIIELAVGVGSLTTGLILWPTNVTTMKRIPMEVPVPIAAPEPAPAPAPAPAPEGT